MNRGEKDEKDGGISPLFGAAFSEEALDAPVQIEIQHAAGRGLKAACGDSGGQIKPRWSGLIGVTCAACRSKRGGR